MVGETINDHIRRVRVETAAEADRAPYGDSLPNGLTWALGIYVLWVLSRRGVRSR
jgi:hypothetical protein